MSATAAPPRRPPPDDDLPLAPPPGLGEAPGPRRGLTARRTALACVIVIALSAAMTVLFIKHEVQTLAGDLGIHKAIGLSSGSLAPVGFGDPQTMLLIGNDQRKHTTTAPVLPHSNEMLLVRLDPSKPWISMMSIPRELQVTLQTPNGPVTTRLNAALIYGGMPLLLSTIRQFTGLSINHVVEIDFNHFKTAVDELGCVYSTVDRRYFHVNTPDSEQYQEIDLQPGYQKLCGTQALEFVSYRHGDTSLVRDARDQDFLLDVKKQFGPTLLQNVHEFERIFGQTVSVDRGLQTESGVEDLLGTLISSESLRVRQVQFQANLQPVGANSCACDTASPQQIAASVHSFLYGASKVPDRGTAAAARAVRHRSVSAKLPLVGISDAALTQAGAGSHQLPFPLEYPRVQDAGGSGVPTDLRTYLISGSDGDRYPAYVAVFSTGQLGQFYDVQGTTWAGAPVLANPDQTVTVAGQTYSLYYSGQHLMLVAWKAHGAVYWVHNTLTDAVGNGEMLAIAEQTLPVGTPGRPGTPNGSGHRPGRARLNAVAVPTRTAETTQTSETETLGALGGLLTVLAIAPLGIVVLRRRRDLTELRAHVHATARLAAHLTAQLTEEGGSAGALPQAAYTKYTSRRARFRRSERSL